MMMKAPIRLWQLLLWVMAAQFTGSVHASPLYWNLNGAGGGGNWSTGPADKYWNLSPAGAVANNSTWSDPSADVAVFQDALGGEVMVIDALQVAGIRHNGANYTLTAGSITLVPDGAAAKPFIEVLSGTLSVNSTLEGSHGLIKTGGGELLLSGNNSYTGDTSILGGTLTNTGTFGASTAGLDIAGGATLVARGTQNYQCLTTSGTGAGIWQENLTNGAIIAPGGIHGFGTLKVQAGDFSDGDFTSTATGTLKLDLAAGNYDKLQVADTARLGGKLDLNQVGPAGIDPFVAVQVLAAGAYAGNFDQLTENLDGAVWFNPLNGAVMRIPDPVGPDRNLFGSTANQTSTWVALYDDVVGPNESNVTRTPGGNPTYQIHSGLADENQQDLLWALTSSFTPTGLNSRLLNCLSPEVYISLADYALQATRSHQRTAFAALMPDSKEGRSADSKGGSKDAAAYSPTGFQWELFAATDFFNVGTRNSPNQADYELSGYGVMLGARTRVTESVQVAAYFAGDEGRANGALFDADGSGGSLGVLGEFLLDATTRTRISGGLAYGSYTFNGTRGSAVATKTRWTHGRVRFNDVKSDSWEMFLGMDGVAYHNDRFRLIPSAGLRCAMGSMDSFNERTGNTPGSPIALSVNHSHDDSALAEFGLLAEADISPQLTLWGQLGASAGLGDDAQAISGRFTNGRRLLQATAAGLSNDLWFSGVGANYQFSDAISVGLGYRTEFRTGANPQSGLNLSSSFRF